MADLSDLLTYLAQASSQAIYPNGESNPSVIGKDVRIYEGWPLPAQLDLDMAGQMMAGNPQKPVPRPGGKVTNVSVFPMQGGVPEPHQILTHDYPIQFPTFGMAFTIAGTTINVTGAPNSGEYLTIIADKVHVFSATGSSVANVLAQLLTQAQGVYPSASATPSSITIPATIQLLVRQGGPGIIGRVTHRQYQYIMISVWAPTHEDRTAVAKAIDNVLKREVVVTMPDTTQARICYNRTNLTDEQTLNTIYRRDLIYQVEYATLWTFPGTVVTSVSVDLVNATGTLDNPNLSPPITFQDP